MNVAAPSVPYWTEGAAFHQIAPMAVRISFAKAISKLSPREQTIIRLRFGLGHPGGREKTQKEVADFLGISQSYISRLEKKIIHRLKREMIKMQ